MSPRYFPSLLGQMIKSIDVANPGGKVLNATDLAISCADILFLSIPDEGKITGFQIFRERSELDGNFTNRWILFAIALTCSRNFCISFSTLLPLLDDYYIMVSYSLCRITSANSLKLTLSNA